MEASMKINLAPLRSLNSPRKLSQVPRRSSSSSVKCAAGTAGKKQYNITLLPGDGIGPEVISVAKNVLDLVAAREGIVFKFQEMPVGGSALDLTGVPLPEETLTATVLSAAMLLKYGLGGVRAAEIIETAVLDTLNRGFQTGDLFAPGNKLVGCKEIGEEVLKSIEAKTPSLV